MLLGQLNGRSNTRAHPLSTASSSMGTSTLLEGDKGGSGGLRCRCRGCEEVESAGPLAVAS
eukprot:237921-Pelagomonas_calceolata.AAC.1